MDEPADTGWRKSRFSAQGDCVQWRLLGEEVEVRNSRVVEGPTLMFTRSEWRAFLDGVRAGDADGP